MAEGAVVVAGSFSTGKSRRPGTGFGGSGEPADARRTRVLVQRALDEHGRIDVLVNDVGAERIRVDGFLATSDEEFEWALQMNFFTGLRATRPALGPNARARVGVYLNIASVNSFFQPDAATVNHGVAKARGGEREHVAVTGIRAEGDRVNCVSPGQVSTDLCLGEQGAAATFAKAARVDADTIRETATSAIASGRFTTPQEVARLVTILASRSHRQRDRR